jgi:hypothetical protein
MTPGDEYVHGIFIIQPPLKGNPEKLICDDKTAL